LFRSAPVTICSRCHRQYGGCCEAHRSEPLLGRHVGSRKEGGESGDWEKCEGIATPVLWVPGTTLRVQPVPPLFRSSCPSSPGAEDNVATAKCSAVTHILIFCFIRVRG